MTRKALLLSGVLPLSLCLAGGARAQDLQDRPVSPPPPSPTGVSQNPDEVQFTADTLEYDYNEDVVTATGDVRLYRESNRLRADKVVWNRKTGKVVASGNIVAINPQGDAAYGESIELTDSLKDGVVENMLVVLDQGGRLAAEHGVRDNGIITVHNAAYTPCNVVDSNNCPKQPSWKITADKIVYNPNIHRIRYTGARISVFGFATIPLPVFSHPAGGGSDDGFLTPDIRYGRTNGFQIALPYYWSFSPNRDLTVTPRVYTNVLPMLQADYRELNELGAFKISAYATYSNRSDDLVGVVTGTSQEVFRGYLDSVGRYQLDPNWSISESIRLTTDRTFLRRYDISRDDRLRNNIRVERQDTDSYLSINGWAVQTLKIGDPQGAQAFALPEIDYRRRFNDGLLGGKFEIQLNSLAIGRTSGQDTQRAFASARWDLRKVNAWGQEFIFTAYGRGDLYHADETDLTLVPSYSGEDGFHARAVGAVAAEFRWPLVGPFLGGTQRITPRLQIVGAPRTSNLNVPNEDARAVDLEDSNLFALNRFPGYDRFEDSSRVTWGLDYALYLPGFSLESTIGQSYRFSSEPTLFPDGTGLSERVSDFVGRTVIHYKDFLTFTHRFRLDKDNLAVRRNEIDATIGTRNTYALLGYLRLNRNITTTLEDLQDREELRVGGRVQMARFWSVFGSALIDLTDYQEDPTSNANGFRPVRHRVGVQYEDDCLRLGLTWKRDYADTGDAKAGNSYLLSLSFKNLGR